MKPSRLALIAFSLATLSACTTLPTAPQATSPATMPLTATPATQPKTDTPSHPTLGQTITTPSGLSYVFTQIGTGPKPQTGDTLVIHGIGRFPDGKEFWNTRTENKPYEYKLGVDRVIKGFSEGMQVVRQGDRIVITMKPELAYGTRGNRDIPPNSTLIFDYEILSIKPKPATSQPNQ